jgi:hypothetical protein
MSKYLIKRVRPESEVRAELEPEIKRLKASIEDIHEEKCKLDRQLSAATTDKTDATHALECALAFVQSPPLVVMQHRWNNVVSDAFDGYTKLQFQFDGTCRVPYSRENRTLDKRNATFTSSKILREVIVDDGDDELTESEREALREIAPMEEINELSYQISYFGHFYSYDLEETFEFDYTGAKTTIEYDCTVSVFAFIRNDIYKSKIKKVQQAHSDAVKPAEASVAVVEQPEEKKASE